MQQLYLPQALYQCARLDRHPQAHHLQRDASTIRLC